MPRATTATAWVTAQGMKMVIAPSRAGAKDAFTFALIPDQARQKLGRLDDEVTKNRMGIKKGESNPNKIDANPDLKPTAKVGVRLMAEPRSPKETQNCVNDQFGGQERNNGEGASLSGGGDD